MLRLQLTSIRPTEIPGGVATRRHRRAAAVVAAVVACAVAVPLAAAATTPWNGVGTALAVACEPAKAQSRQVFSAFGDTSSYIPAPSGTFETGTTGWTLTGGAGVVAGNETYYVGGRKDKASLRLPSGASATSPAICVGVEHPYSRLFAKGPSGATLGIDLLYVDGSGNPGSFTIAKMTGTGSWAVSPKLYTGSFLLSGFSDLSTTTTAKSATSSYTAIAYRFTSSGGAFQVDDLFVDPFKL